MLAQVSRSNLFGKCANIDFISLGDPSFHLPGIMATVFPSVSDAAIRLQGKAIEHGKIHQTQKYFACRSNSMWTNFIIFFFLHLYSF